MQANFSDPYSLESLFNQECHLPELRFKPLTLTKTQLSDVYAFRRALENAEKQIELIKRQAVKIKQPGRRDQIYSETVTSRITCRSNHVLFVCTC